MNGLSLKPESRKVGSSTAFNAAKTLVMTQAEKCQLDLETQRDGDLRKTNALGAEAKTM